MFSESFQFEISRFVFEIFEVQKFQTRRIKVLKKHFLTESESFSIEVQLMKVKTPSIDCYSNMHRICE